MGTKLKDIMSGREIKPSELSGKTIAIDAFNWIFQFLTTIRMADGSYLTDKEGRVTTHLNGLFYRSINLLSNKINPVFVFDGPAPKFKKKTLEERKTLKEEAIALSKSASTPEEKAMYLRRAARIDDYIVESSKELLSLMGISTIQAPAEGEAQAAKLSEDSLVYAAASQDYDTFLFGAKRVVRNLNVTNRRKVLRKGISSAVMPEVFETSECLNKLGISREGLILIALFSGTDYNKGVDGVGPKKALQLVKKKDKASLLSSYDFGSDYDINDIFGYFLHPNVLKLDSLPQQKKLDTGGLLDFLCEKHGFERDRVLQSIEKLDIKQGSLFDYG